MVLLYQILFFWTEKRYLGSPTQVVPQFGLLGVRLDLWMVLLYQSSFFWTEKIYLGSPEQVIPHFGLNWVRLELWMVFALGFI
jgi:hypothetical protein